MSRQTKFDHSKIIELKLQGKSNYEIEKIIGCGHTLIGNVLNEAGLTKKVELFSEDEVKIINKYYRDFGANYCAQYIDRSPTSIMAYAYKRGIRYKQPNNKKDHSVLSDDNLRQSIKSLQELGYSDYYIKLERKKRNISPQEKYSEHEINFIKENYPVHGYKYCIDNLSISKTKLKNILCKFKIAKNTRYDLNYVDCPDAYMSYVLGILTADGYISNYDKSKCHTISLNQNVDDITPLIPILYKHIKWRMSAYINNGWGNKIMINLSMGDRHKIFWNNLIRFGFDNKTYIFPNFTDYIQDCYIKYYIRGFFDGDGHVVIDKNNKHGVIGFTGHKECNWETLVNCLSKYDIDTKYYKQHNCSRLVITRQKSLKNYIENFYQSDNIYLPRKFKKIQRLATILSCKIL